MHVLFITKGETTLGRSFGFPFGVGQTIQRKKSKQLTHTVLALQNCDGVNMLLNNPHPSYT